MDLFRERADDEKKREMIDKIMRQIKTTASKQMKQKLRRAGAKGVDGR